MGDIAHGDHGIPVLFQMADLVLAGDIGGGEYTHYTGQRFGGIRMDGQHSGSGVGGADGGGVDHPVEVHIIGVLTVAQHLLPHIDTGDIFADAPVGIGGGNLALALQLGGQQHGLDDLHITGTAADIVLDGFGAVLLCGVLVPIQKRLGIGTGRLGRGTLGSCLPGQKLFDAVEQILHSTHFAHILGLEVGDFIG